MADKNHNSPPRVVEIVSGVDLGIVGTRSIHFAL